MATPNATFHSFKPSGKWYTTDRGHLPETIHTVYTRRERQNLILAANGDRYPGLSHGGSHFTWVIIPDEEGLPLLFHTEL